MTAPVTRPVTGAAAAVAAALAARDSERIVALLRENEPCWTGCSPAEVAQLRGCLLAALAGLGMPDAGLEFAREELETGIEPAEVAGAAIGLRGRPGLPADLLALLPVAAQRLAGRDRTVTVESVHPTWPYAHPTTALAELRETTARFAEPAGGCCGRPVPQPQQCAEELGQAVAVQDQDGAHSTLDAVLGGRPAVVAFFYTRCDNPEKCSATVTGLAALQRMLRADGIAGAVTIAGITYDPAFDLPERLRRYGADRGVAFDARTRFLRVTAGFDTLRRRLDLGVGYGGATVNRHQIEVYLLDAGGRAVAAFRRARWDAEALRRAVAELLPTEEEPCARSSG